MLSLDPYVLAGVLGGLLMVAAAVYIAAWLRRPARRYQGPESVSQIYDEWVEDRILVQGWGGHLHAGDYGDPPVRKNLIQAKDDMVDEMLRWGLEAAPKELRERMARGGEAGVSFLDVGCGLGATVRRLAVRWPAGLSATGLTLSGGQARFAAAKAAEQGLGNTAFVVGDAVAQPFPQDHFDIVWTLEAEVHVPDHVGFMREILRVLKPGGVLVMGTWNVRDDRNHPLTVKEKETVTYLLDEWNHAQFRSIATYVGLMEAMGLRDVVGEDWTERTVPSWRESLKEPFRRPGLLRGYHLPALMRNGYTLYRYDRAFREGLLEYGLFRGRK